MFLFGLQPRFFGFCCVLCCLLRCFRWRNASLAGGFAGRRFLFGCGFQLCCFNRFADSKDPSSLYSVFSAYSHVRTEPLARHRPHSRKKNINLKLDDFFVPEPVCLSAGLRYLRLTRLPRHDRGPVPGGNRSAASCPCTVLRRASYHYATRSAGVGRSRYTC